MYKSAYRSIVYTLCITVRIYCIHYFHKHISNIKFDLSKSTTTLANLKKKTTPCKISEHSLYYILTLGSIPFPGMPGILSLIFALWFSKVPAWVPITLLCLFLPHSKPWKSNYPGMSQLLDNLVFPLLEISQGTSLYLFTHFKTRWLDFKLLTTSKFPRIIGLKITCAGRWGREYQRFLPSVFSLSTHPGLLWAKSERFLWTWANKFSWFAFF